MWVDTHCHLTHPRLSADLDAVLERASAAGVARCLTIGTGTEDARAGRELARARPGRIACAAGIDPFTAHRAGDGFDAELAALESLLREGDWDALGEIGLDYHYDLDPRPVQRERFERQLDLAARLDLPVVIHVRDAHDDMASVLEAHRDNRGVVHSFTAGPREAERYLAAGWHLAFNGVATFRNAEEVREAARLAPPERLLVETDSPYLAPVPHRGKRCEPAYAAISGAFLAELRGETPERLAARTTANACALFGWDPPA